MKVIGYLCLNTQDQAKDTVSLREQEVSIRAWAERNRASEVVIFRDEGLSEKRVEDRPGLSAATLTIGICETQKAAYDQ